jgi:hypothetical protein
MPNTVELEVQVFAKTAQALRVATEKGQAWVPRSQITDWSPGQADLEDATSIFIPQWLAEEKGLV